MLNKQEQNNHIIIYMRQLKRYPQRLRDATFEARGAWFTATPGSVRYEPHHTTRVHFDVITLVLLTRFAKGLSSLGFGERKDQSTTRLKNAPTTRPLRRTKPTLSLIAGPGGDRERAAWVTEAPEGDRRAGSSVH